ncbi:hypothetical protein [Pseudalkalibacillus hwajinpoensis]|uniref:Uncharacterized protein n=1 Tax=Guptibacillus hwajinpoensis TaxID=208199 RepID=A0A4U1MKF0_9BACL|nr:hypothetical protein [Pseudalkalibacillus hwajinpoensis]TKD71046.1 hypothetical protein FBF83_10645 [Pseudalkalibacillus hwajinpoensis]
MELYVFLSLLLNLLLGLLVFKRMFQSRKLFSDRFGMIVTTNFSGVFNFSIGLHLYLVMPDHFAIISLAIVIGIGSGVIIGAIVKFHSVLAGFFHGTVGTLMGTMLGVIIINPSLCRLPAVNEAMLNQTIVVLCSFITILTISTLGLIYYSFRV